MKIAIVFVNLENLRIFQIYIFTGGAVKANGIARFFRRAALPKEAALQMPFISAPFPRENGTPERPQTLRCAEIKNNFPLKSRRAKRRAV